MQAQLLSTTASSNQTFVRPHSSLAEGAGLAHDAGNLLGALGLYCDLLHAPGVLRPEHRHYATELRLLSQRSSALIRRLLLQAMPESATFADTSSGAGLATNPLNDPALTLRALEPLLWRIAQPCATVEVEIGDRLPSLPFPAEALERIVLNLVRNAAEALHQQRVFSGHTGGRIRVALHMHRSGRQLQLVVEDNGPGLGMRVASSFLYPESALPTATRGFGHHIVHELAHSTGAGLELRVRPAQGTTFLFTWNIVSQPLRRSRAFSRTQGVPHAC